MNLKEAIDKFVDSPVHIYLDNGCYVTRDYKLQFDKKEHDKLFSNGHYIPTYKKWLIENSILIYKDKMCCQHTCDFKLNNCCWECSAANECKSICRLNPNECEKGDE